MQQVFEFYDVNHAFDGLTRWFSSSPPEIERSDSRYGEVLYVTNPLVVTYNNPTMKVLFNRERNANPFFHLYEALWMLAGRNDVEPLSYYSSKISAFSDDGQTIPGAYGRRWRKLARDNQGIADQLRILMRHLRDKPESRRAVLSMWSLEEDLHRINASKDVPCNTEVYLSLSKFKAIPNDLELNITVCNRSNDLVLGMLGANYVQFSLLMEYLAGCLEVRIGRYHQFTNNLHIYTKDIKFDKWHDSSANSPIYYYNTPGISPSNEYVPIIVAQKSPPLRNDFPSYTSWEENVTQLDDDIYSFTHIFGQPFNGDFEFDTCSRFLNTIAAPMLRAFDYYKEDNFVKAYETLNSIPIVNNDWKLAGTNWLKRIESNRKKGNTHVS